MDENNDYDSNKINRKFPIKINDLRLENKLEIINHENNDDNDNELGIQNLTTKFSSSSSSSTSNDNHLLINNHQIPTTSRINNDNNHHQQQQQQNNDHQIFKNISSTTTPLSSLTSSSLMPVNNTAPVNAIVDISMSSPSSSSLLQPPPPPSPSLSSSISSSPSPSLSATPMKTLSNIVVEKNCLDTDNVDDFHHNREQIIESTNVSNNSDNQYAQDKCQNYSLFQPKQNKQIRTISIDQQPNNVLEIEQINIDDDDDNYNDIESNKRKKTGNRHHRVNNNSDIDDNDDDCNHYARDNIHRINPTTNVGDGVLDESGVRSHSSRRQSHHSSSSSSSSNQNIDYLLSLLPPNDLQMEMPFEDPIQIRGNGNITLFGLFNCYESTFPTALLGRVSKEEFEYTIGRINNLLQQQHSTNIKFLLLGCLCCCFSLGCSLLWPGFALSRRTKNSLEKLLAMENSRLYNKLGLNWRLSKQPSHTNHSFMEYILVIDFLPKIHIYQPD